MSRSAELIVRNYLAEADDPREESFAGSAAGETHEHEWEAAEDAVRIQELLARHRVAVFLLASLAGGSAWKQTEETAGRVTAGAARQPRAGDWDSALRTSLVDVSIVREQLLGLAAQVGIGPEVEDLLMGASLPSGDPGRDALLEALRAAAEIEEEAFVLVARRLDELPPSASDDRVA